VGDGGPRGPGAGEGLRGVGLDGWIVGGEMVG